MSTFMERQAAAWRRDAAQWEHVADSADERSKPIALAERDYCLTRAELADNLANAGADHDGNAKGVTPVDTSGRAA